MLTPSGRIVGAEEGERQWDARRTLDGLLDTVLVDLHLLGVHRERSVKCEAILKELAEGQPSVPR